MKEVDASLYLGRRPSNSLSGKIQIFRALIVRQFNEYLKLDSKVTADADSAWPTETGIHIARARALTGKGIRVLVLDTGIDADHEEFYCKSITFTFVPHVQGDTHLVRNVRGFDTQGHGSHVAGIIAGSKNGIAPDADLSVASICESETPQSGLVRFEEGLKWVLDLCNDGMPSVLNLSIGYFPPPTSQLSEERWDDLILVLRRTLSRLELANVMVLSAWTPTYQVPAEFQEVIAVGALDHNFRRLHSGHYAPRKPDILGLGSDIRSAAGRERDGRSMYVSISGASQATAYVTGIAALWRQAFPQLNVRETREMLMKHALPLGHEDVMLESSLARYVAVDQSDET